MNDPNEVAVLTAAAALVDAFGRHDRQAYFDCFLPSASFIFYTVEQPLISRSAYEQLWESWERDAGFRVVSCTSVDGAVRIFGDVAVFTHRVLTEIESDGQREALDERETIVFARQPDLRWLAIHEHLSPSPHEGGP
ncbi:MAG: nuclear transport factor 2 family protein [Actinomycetota bacterium]|nr:nuclear transport factor 2 family protein [Actinomycetota bacterium]